MSQVGQSLRGGGGGDCPHNFVLSSLFPMVSHSARVARSLKMFKEVRSSELETGGCPRLMTV